jgi:metal transporter CNNM
MIACGTVVSKSGYLNFRLPFEVLGNNSNSLVLESIQKLEEALASHPPGSSLPSTRSKSYIREALTLLKLAVSNKNSSRSLIATRNLEDSAPDDDDYFQESFGDVRVSYDEQNETIVTVGDNVIVVVEHQLSHYIYNGVMLMICILIGALMSGLLMGVMTLDPLMMGIKARVASTIDERKMAVKLIPFTQNKNLVLVSILLVNCGVNEALPVFFDAILESPFLSVLCSLSVVLVIGEILPSAYFTGKDQLKIAYYLIPILRFVILMTAPVSYPISFLMDKFFHDSDDRSSFNRGELSALVRIQYEERLASHRQNSKSDVKGHSLRDCGIGTFPVFGYLTEDRDFSMLCTSLPSCQEGMENELDDDDVVKVQGALGLKTKKVEHAFTPLQQLVALSAETVLDEEKIVELYSKGFSRIPVFKKLNDQSNVSGICGILLTKQLILVKKEDRRFVSTLPLYCPPCMSPNTNFSEALNILQSGARTKKSSNMALVCMQPEIATDALKQGSPVPVEAGVLGIITLENVLEELIQDKIYDEKDRKTNPALERAKWAIAKWKVFTLQRRLERECEEEYASENPFNYFELRELV